MWHTSEAYLRSLDTGCISLVIEMIIQDEMADEKCSQSSTLAQNPNLARHSLPRTLLDIPVDYFRGIIAESLLRDNLFPPVDLPELMPYDGEIPDSQESSFRSQSTQISRSTMGSWTSEDEFVLGDIEECRIENKRVEYLARWKGKLDLWYSIWLF
jgi:hypothetical protein